MAEQLGNNQDEGEVLSAFDKSQPVDPDRLSEVRYTSVKVTPIRIGRAAIHRSGQAGRPDEVDNG